jgi:hypothetical protein
MRKQQADVGFVVTVDAGKFNQLVTIRVARFRAAAHTGKDHAISYGIKRFFHILLVDS